MKELTTAEMTALIDKYHKKFSLIWPEMLKDLLKDTDGDLEASLQLLAYTVESTKTDIYFNYMKRLDPKKCDPLKIAEKFSKVSEESFIKTMREGICSNTWVEKFDTKNLEN